MAGCLLEISVFRDQLEPLKHFRVKLYFKSNPPSAPQISAFCQPGSLWPQASPPCTGWRGEGGDPRLPVMAWLGASTALVLWAGLVCAKEKPKREFLKTCLHLKVQFPEQGGLRGNVPGILRLFPN